MTQPILYIAIGPSGSGKSTLFKKLQTQNPNINYFSWDALRHEWYDTDDYTKAFELSCFDKQFKLKADARFHELLRRHQDLYIDNTNLTMKRRRPFIEAAKRLGYKTIAVTFFNIDLKTLISRQATRGDKYVPENAVAQQYEGIQPPMWKEFDEVITSESI